MEKSWSLVSLLDLDVCVFIKSDQDFDGENVTSTYRSSQVPESLPKYSFRYAEDEEDCINGVNSQDVHVHSARVALQNLAVNESRDRRPRAGNSSGPSIRRVTPNVMPPTRDFAFALPSQPTFSFSFPAFEKESPKN